MATRKKVYADYAAFVARTEEETNKLQYNALKARRKRYWEPLNQHAVQLQTDYQISAEELARLIKEGLEQKWPTEQPADRIAVLKMFDRNRAETKLLARRVDATANRMMLDRLFGMALSQATAAGTMQNNLNADTARRAVGGR
jgi:hypothetical protein